ncbi:MAG: hypothetical protein ACQESP_02540 [Candidatus Muiribacteriota bacterium]
MNFFYVLFKPQILFRKLGEIKVFYRQFLIIVFMFMFNQVLTSPYIRMVIEKDAVMSGDKIMTLTAQPFFGALFMGILMSVIIGFFSLYYLFFMNIITGKSRVNSRGVLSLVVYSYFIRWIESLAEFGVIAFSDLDKIESYQQFQNSFTNIFSINNLFLSTNIEILDNFFSYITIFSLWQAFLIAAGLAFLYKVKFFKSIIPVLFIYALILLWAFLETGI